MPTAQQMGAIGYERQGHLFNIIGQMLSGIIDRGSAYFTTTVWEAVRSFYVGWKWAMDALTDGFRAAAADPALSTKFYEVLGGIADNSSAYFGPPGGAGGRGYLTTAAVQALHASQAFGQAPDTWASGASSLLTKVAEVYALFWRNAP